MAEMVNYIPLFQYPSTTLWMSLQLNGAVEHSRIQNPFLNQADSGVVLLANRATCRNHAKHRGATAAEWSIFRAYRDLASGQALSFSLALFQFPRCLS